MLPGEHRIAAVTRQEPTEVMALGQLHRFSVIVRQFKRHLRVRRGLVVTAEPIGDESPLDEHRGTLGRAFRAERGERRVEMGLREGVISQAPMGARLAEFGPPRICDRKCRGGRPESSERVRVAPEEGPSLRDPFVQTRIDLGGQRQRRLEMTNRLDVGVQL